MRNCRHISLAVVTVLIGVPLSAAATAYHCLPLQVAEDSNRIHALCGRPNGSEGGYPTDGGEEISAFAVPKSDADVARRFLNVMQTALVAGVVVRIEYTGGDKSGASFGCGTGCRTPRVFGLVAPATDVRVPLPQAVAKGQWLKYGGYSICEAQDLVVKISGTGDGDLYVRQGAEPTETAFDCRPSITGSITETCTMTAAGNYFVGVKGVGATNSFSLYVARQGDCPP